MLIHHERNNNGGGSKAKNARPSIRSPEEQPTTQNVTLDAAAAEDNQSSAMLRSKNFSFPAFYWLNLDKSVERREAMVTRLLSLGIFNNYRVASITSHNVSDMYRSNRLIMHPKVTLVEDYGPGAKDEERMKSQGNWSYREAACTLSHLMAIKKAYDAGHDQAIIAEDDSIPSETFRDSLADYVKYAPEGWKVLQLATSHPLVIQQGLVLRDPFVPWLPHHWSTGAYMVSRLGMEELVHKMHTYDAMGRDVWRIQEKPFVVADEVLYGTIGDAYTSTGLWIAHSFSFGSTLHEGGPSGREYPALGELHHQYEMKTSPRFFDKALLVLMHVMVHDQKDARRELAWIKQDRHTICKFYTKCDWHINVQVNNSSLIGLFEQDTSLSPHIHLHIKLSSEENLDKMSLVRESVGLMGKYDLIIIKDHNLRTSGFPWQSFVEAREDAVISSPLRGLLDDSFYWRFSHPDRNNDRRFKIHDAKYFAYLGSKWSVNQFRDVRQTEVPTLEQFFVLMDAQFAVYFFDLIVRFEKRHDLSDTIPWHHIMCQAAREWSNRSDSSNRTRPGCSLVPVVSKHEDLPEAKSNINHHDVISNDVLQAITNHSAFGKWIEPSLEWKKIAFNKEVQEIEELCRNVLKLRNSDSFDLQACCNHFILRRYSAQEQADAFTSYRRRKPTVWKRTKQYDKKKAVVSSPDDCPASSMGVDVSKRLELLHITKTGGTTLEILGAQHGISWGACHFLSRVADMPPGMSCPGARTLSTANSGKYGPELHHSTSSLNGISLWHAPPKYLRKHETWWLDNANWFTIVREPYSRVVSAYRYISSDSNPSQSQSADAMNVWIEKTLNKIFSSRPINGRKWKPDYFSAESMILVPQYEYIDERVRVLRMESLKQDFACLLKDHGLSWEWPKQSYNKSRLGHLTIANITASNLRLIEKVYHQDFLKLGYPMLKNGASAKSQF